MIQVFRLEKSYLPGSRSDSQNQYPNRLEMTGPILKHIVIIAFAVLTGQSVLAADRFGVYASIAPQKYSVQQIGKDLIDVRIMVPPGASPAAHEPRPKQMMELGASGIYFAIGVAFVQPRFSTTSAEIVAGEIGGRVAFDDPLAEDWMDNLAAVAASCKAALK